jgi:Tannase-like family of unknown function (DUF6351)
VRPSARRALLATPVDSSKLLRVGVLAVALAFPASAAAAKPITISVLSTRADLVSGGDALVRVGGVTSAKGLRVTVRGKNRSKLFAKRADGHVEGLVTGLRVGKNTVVASAGKRAAKLVVTNHPRGGPVFSGPQLQPWKCKPTAKDAQCNQPATFSYLYKSTDGSAGFKSYDPKSPPSDVANTTTDRGVTVPFIVRVETGYIDRDQYTIAALFQPGKKWSATSPQKQFDHKLLLTHGAGCGADHQPASAPSVTDSAPVDTTGASGAETALGRGFAVASNALDNAGHNCNVASEAEALLMTKEHLIERYGTLRYTIGTGCSGGSLAQQWISNAYPGIYQGILPTCSFPDAWGTSSQFLDYHQSLRYFNDPSLWGAGVAWTPQQMADVQGHVSIANSIVSDNAQWHVVIPTDPCAGVTAEQRYDPNTNPGGTRCTIQDAAINVLGPRPESVWTPQEKKIGRGFAGVPTDNVGVQYGLKALQQAKITPAQFVDLNQKMGGISLVDAKYRPERLKADQPTLANAYRTGMINEANNMASTAIIDCRGPDPGAFHDAYRAFAMRARLDRANGNHVNQLIWEGPGLIIGDTRCEVNSFDTMDTWLAAVEKDHGKGSVAQKVARDKPKDATDRCYDGNGTKVSDGLCGEAVVPIYGTPRTVAGDALTTDTNKCQLKPLNRSDDYGPIPLTDDQWAALQQAFPGGVCDYSKPGVDQQKTIPWQTYQTAKGKVIYGGKPMGAPPRSHSVRVKRTG